jgi:hypothetical protein
MASAHGRLTNVTVATKDISPYCKTSSYELTADNHDTTGYGATAHTKAGGLTDGTFSAGGTYDNTVSVGPRNALANQLGVTQAIVRKVEGTGTGKPQDTFNAVLTKYTETNPVDDMVTWAATWEISGAIVTIAQP